MRTPGSDTIAGFASVSAAKPLRMERGPLRSNGNIQSLRRYQNSNRVCPGFNFGLVAVDEDPGSDKIAVENK